ncbi:MAG: T9SS type A sorting domain-containing protein [Chitinophagales bacterium]|nr:T9SS type A sorting domain-containing protein [Chitinophagales bacterium]
MRFYIMLVWLAGLLLLPISNSFAQCGYRYQDSLLFSAKVTKDIVYGQVNVSKNHVKNLYLDFYEPEGDQVVLRPLLIFLQGGSFLSGSKNYSEVVLPCTNLAQRGFAVAGVEYRLEDNYLALVLSELMLKASLKASQDAKAAIRFFYKQAREWGNPYRIDTNQIFLGGVSAGAVTALQVAYLDDADSKDFLLERYINDLGGLEGNSGNEGYSTKIKGVVNIAGASLDKNFVNNNRDIPLLNVQYINDQMLPSYYGRPLGIITLPVMMGSYVLARQMERQGIYNVNNMIKGMGTVPYIKDGGAYQPNFDNVMSSVASFMFSLLDCNPAQVNLQTVQPRVIKELSIFPNPATDYIVLGEQNFDINLIRKIRIIDMMGHIVLYAKSQRFPYVIDLGGLPRANGFYVIEALSSENEILAQQKLFLNK